MVRYRIFQLRFTEGQGEHGDADSFVQFSEHPYLADPFVSEGSSFLFNAEWSQSMKNEACYKDFLDPKNGCIARTYTMHVAHLDGLQPRTRYYYKVGGPQSGWSGAFSFMTQPAPAGGRDAHRVLVGFSCDIHRK